MTRPMMDEEKRLPLRPQACVELGALAHVHAGQRAVDGARGLALVGVGRLRQPVCCRRGERGGAQGCKAGKKGRQGGESGVAAGERVRLAA